MTVPVVFAVAAADEDAVDGGVAVVVVAAAAGGLNQTLNGGQRPQMKKTTAMLKKWRVQQLPDSGHDHRRRRGPAGAQNLQIAYKKAVMGTSRLIKIVLPTDKSLQNSRGFLQTAVV